MDKIKQTNINKKLKVRILVGANLFRIKNKVIV